MTRKLALFAFLIWLLASPALRAVDKRAVQQAITQGVRALQAMQAEDGTWPYSECGATALAAVTLLECGVPTSDPSLVKATRALRRASTAETHTYSLALLIIYFDRLGDANDVPLIESLTVRLMAGQQADGGWTYTCPGLNEVEARRLLGNATQEKILVGRRDRGARRRTLEDLPREIRAQLQQVQQGGQAVSPDQAALATIHPTDNSNTQFATLALWVARRHGLPVENALDRIAHRYRQSQNNDGAWSYTARPLGLDIGPLTSSSASMACAGLLGLAVGNGAVIEKGKNKEALVRAAKQDRNIQAGLLYLGAVIGEPTGDVRRAPEAGGGSFYFLWSLERVAVALGMDTIGKKDWYSWGAEILLANQQRDGSWVGAYAPCGADTCFALLFLKRANFAEDLTTELRGSIADPGRMLTGRGMRETSGGGRLKSALDPKGSKGPPSRGADIPTARGPVVKLTGLAAELAGAEAEKQEELLARYRDGKGVKYTEQLAVAIFQLEGDLKQKARHALADRLTRMKVETLEGYLEDEDTEIRRAAALAVAMKDARTLTPRLIGLLEDAQPTVARAAHAALKSLSGKDFGPQQGASAGERHKAVAAWRDWWQQRGK